MITIKVIKKEMSRCWHLRITIDFSKILSSVSSYLYFHSRFKYMQVQLLNRLTRLLNKFCLLFLDINNINFYNLCAQQSEITQDLNI